MGLMSLVSARLSVRPKANTVAPLNSSVRVSASVGDGVSSPICCSVPRPARAAHQAFC